MILTYVAVFRGARSLIYKKFLLCDRVPLRIYTDTISDTWLKVLTDTKTSLGSHAVSVSALLLVNVSVSVV